MIFALLIYRTYLPNYVQKIAFYVFEIFYLILWHTPKQPSIKTRLFSLFLRDVLWELTKLNPAFKLNYSVMGEEKLVEIQKEYGSALIFTGHFGLSMASHFALLDMGISPIFVVNTDNGSRDISGFNWGTKRNVSLIDAQQPDVLFQIGLALHIPNSAIVAFVDYYEGGLCVSPNLFSWAYLKNMPIIFMVTSPRDNGLINISFHSTPFMIPSSRNEAYICAQSFSDLMEKELGKIVVVRKRYVRTPISTLSPCN